MWIQIHTKYWKQIVSQGWSVFGTIEKKGAQTTQLVFSPSRLPPGEPGTVINGERLLPKQHRPPASRSEENTSLLLVACDADHVRSLSSSDQLQKWSLKV